MDLRPRRNAICYFFFDDLFISFYEIEKDPTVIFKRLALWTTKNRQNRGFRGLYLLYSLDMEDSPNFDTNAPPFEVRGCKSRNRTENKV